MEFGNLSPNSLDPLRRIEATNFTPRKFVASIRYKGSGIHFAPARNEVAYGHIIFWFCI